ncbi:MAG: sigma-54-dependent Fis family transcriptional regulator [Burkholderiaceae bacterium]|nr:sigma-54-dependent Fis family transcriptional regulator [Burkholderiaceae bacterium]
MRSPHPSQIFSRPEDDTNIMSTWERFLSGEVCGSDAIRRLIDDSWRRCHSAQVDPGRDKAPPALPEDALHNLLGEHDELLSAGTSVMAHARQFLDETGTVMVLTTNDGIILNLEGDAATSAAAAERIRMIPGSSWSEATVGTNAIGTALAIGQPVQIHSAEHYCAGIKRWTCSATVVRDPYNNSILGAIDVSGLNATYNRHSLALVVTTASRIESRLARREMELRYRLLELCVSRLGRSTNDGVILLDRRGNPIKVSDKAQAALSALNAAGKSSSPINLSTLKIPTSFKSAAAENLPDWINRDWLEPIIENGQKLGSILTIPNRSAAVTLRSVETVSTKPTCLKNEAFERVIGKAPKLLEVIEFAQRLSKSTVPLLLLGETGVGKDVFARAIHETSAAREAPFVALNCGGFSRELLTSELFGYADGSFTGARRGGMIGKIEAASGGTLFLDEIGEMPIDLQPHFLRVLEDGAIFRIGENKPRNVSFRLVAATNRDLRKEVSEGRFRMDLFYRIAVASINIPPLRERAEDIQLISDFLLDKLSQQHAVFRPVLDPEALDCLSRHAWPGNIRELRNVLERALLMSSDAVITKESLPHEVRFAEPAGTQRLASVSQDGELKRLEQVEKDTIISMIERQNGNMTAVARELGIAKSTLYVKLKKFDIALAGTSVVDVSTNGFAA